MAIEIYTVDSILMGKYYIPNRQYCRGKMAPAINYNLSLKLGYRYFITNVSGCFSIEFYKLLINK